MTELSYLERELIKAEEEIKKQDERIADLEEICIELKECVITHLTHPEHSNLFWRATRVIDPKVNADLNEQHHVETQEK